MPTCVVICRTRKPKERQGKILFINAANEITRERTETLLTGDHIARIVKAHAEFRDEPGFSRVATLAEVCAKDGNLSLPLSVAPATAQGGTLALEAQCPKKNGLSSWMARMGCAVGRGRRSKTASSAREPSRCQWTGAPNGWANSVPAVTLRSCTTAGLPGPGSTRNRTASFHGDEVYRSEALAEAAGPAAVGDRELHTRRGDGGSGD